MRLFLDASVLLAACGSAAGASCEIFRRAQANDWVMISTPYALSEDAVNLPSLPAAAAPVWNDLRPKLLILDDILTLDRPAVFSSTSDRPIPFGALAWSDILLTLDRGDFGGLMNEPFYGLIVMTPGAFLERERIAKRLA